MSQSHEVVQDLVHDVSAAGAAVIGETIPPQEQALLNKKIQQNYGTSDIEAGQPTESPKDVEYAMPRRKLYTVVSSIYMAAFLAAMDTTVVTTLLTVISSDLNAADRIGWIATAYLLSCSAFQPIYGKLSDIFGRKALLLTSCAFFAVGCCICVTDSLMLLVVGRFITGCGGSGLTILGTITMSDIIPLRERGLYQGMANICFGLGAASGGLIGGVIADYWGWKYVFILQVPLAVLVGVVIYFNLVLPEGSPGLGSKGSDFSSKLKRVDFLGASLLVSSLMLILIAASLGGSDIAYSSKSFIGLLLAASVLLGSFVYCECYVSREPIIPMEVMTERTVLAASFANWFYTMGVFSYLFFVPMFFQVVMGLSATESGQRLVPNFFALSFGSVGAGYYMKKTGKYYHFTVVVGALTVLGMINVVTVTPAASLFKQYSLLVVPGFGYACILTVTLLALIAAVPSEFQACTTSIQYTFRSTGSTIGVSVASAIFANVTKANLERKIPQIIKDPAQAAKIIRKAIENTNYIASTPADVRDAIRDSYEFGCRGTFVFSIAVIALGYLSALFMREHVLHTSVNRA